MSYQVLVRFLLILTGLNFSITVSRGQINLVGDNRIVYDSIDSGTLAKPEFDLFLRGIEGYNALALAGKIPNPGILTIIDFRKSGNEKRMWVIDLTLKKILFTSLVAHGRNSGELYPTRFSNLPNSNQSSLGFFSTGSIYTGKHGTSLKLHGLEKDINDKAEQRAIVMHGADYVSENFITKVGRLGRSFGCPAIPMKDHDKVIRLLADGTCLFIFYPDREYIEKSVFSAHKQIKPSSLSSQ